MNAKYALLILGKFQPETSAWTMTIRKATYEGSFAEIVMASKVRYTIYHVEVRGAEGLLTFYREFYLTGKSSHRRALSLFSTLLIKRKMRNAWLGIKKRVLRVLGRKQSPM